jgi:hypothetical protein
VGPFQALRQCVDVTSLECLIVALDEGATDIFESIANARIARVEPTTNKRSFLIRKAESVLENLSQSEVQDSFPETSSTAKVTAAPKRSRTYPKRILARRDKNESDLLKRFFGLD